VKPRWKCPTCGTFNGMTDNCKKCKKDCFTFSIVPDLVQPDEIEEESIKALQPKVTPAKQISPKANTNQYFQSSGIHTSIYEENQEKYWECRSCKVVNKTMFGKHFACDGCSKHTFNGTKFLDHTKQEIIVGRKFYQFWVCVSCRQENGLT
jgi:hypothetical protein